jgi:isoaspartyl peptidase/L-asparaginase-like protein (Ntn-hydrolase superfamily)
VIALAVHGGAGPTPSADRWPDLRAGVAAAVVAGWALLDRGAPALDAVSLAVRVLEDDPAFNAGRGSALTCDATVEMDAAVMNGHDGRAGGVAGVCGLRHPVDAARCVLDDARHVLLCGSAATEFARERGVETAPEEWLVTERQRERLAAWRARGDRVGAPGGTVGAVARDAHGHVAAATSTGGTVGKRSGRIGDSPLPGAGTWADDATAAISATGDGEAIIRAQLAHEIDAAMRHAGLDLADAAARGLDRVARCGGEAGLVAIDATGNIALPFISGAMSRAWRVGDGPLLAAILPGDAAPVS